MPVSRPNSKCSGMPSRHTDWLRFGTRTRWWAVPPCLSRMQVNVKVLADLQYCHIRAVDDSICLDKYRAGWLCRGSIFVGNIILIINIHKKWIITILAAYYDCCYIPVTSSYHRDNGNLLLESPIFDIQLVIIQYDDSQGNIFPCLSIARCILFIIFGVYDWSGSYNKLAFKVQIIVRIMTIYNLIKTQSHSFAVAPSRANAHHNWITTLKSFTSVWYW